MNFGMVPVIKEFRDGYFAVFIKLMEYKLHLFLHAHSNQSVLLLKV